MNTKGTAAALAAAVLAASCSSGGGTTPAAATQAANTLVCRHYLAQRTWVKKLAFSTLADAAKFAGYIGADDGQARPGTKLRRDLDAMVTAIQAGKPDYAASMLVYRDCT